MKIVFQTQVLENYNWDEPKNPYWKPKGGNTYIAHNVSLEDNLSEEFWSFLKLQVEENHEMYQEYIIAEMLIDDCDFKISNHCQEWEKPKTLRTLTL